MYNTPNVVTTTSFELDHYIKTPAWIVKYRVITRSSNFPYHLNLINNLNVRSTTTFTAPTTYSTNKNYSQATNGNLFTTMTPISGSNYSNIKIITYLSCFGFHGTNNTPPIVYVDTTVLNSTYITFVISLGTTGYIDRIHLNLVVYDQAQL